MRGKVLMVQGTSSSAGKSLLVTALCRIFARRGLKVAPFKAQNMSNNAAVCGDGAEIGRAQALQAMAAGIVPTADMNPLLLKPEGQSRSQVIVQGKAWRTLSARDFYRHKSELWPIVTAALDRLRQAYELVIIEGAGSPVELNLRDGDIVNMAVARHAGAPVLLVGDIDRGGIFAQLLGTLWLLQPAERELVRGLIINKFRGDPALFADGVSLLEERGKVPVLGVVPYVNDLNLPEEDAVVLFDEPEAIEHSHEIDIAVIRLAHIANFDDFDPLRAEPGVQVRYVDNVAALGQPDAIILPGTKTTVADLRWLRSQGLAGAIRRRVQEGTAIVGVCGGYQMLGRLIRDPHGIESANSAVEGLGLLPGETTFAAGKSTHQVRGRVRGGPGWLANLAGEPITGYEIHMGQTPSADGWLEIVERNATVVSVLDGAVTENGRIWGCYLHGLFANDKLRRSWLASLRVARPESSKGVPVTGSLPPRPSKTQGVPPGIDRLADAVEAALDIERLDEIVYTTCQPASR